MKIQRNAKTNRERVWHEVHCGHKIRTNVLESFLFSAVAHGNEQTRGEEAQSRMRGEEEQTRTCVEEEQSRTRGEDEQMPMRGKEEQRRTHGEDGDERGAVDADSRCDRVTRDGVRELKQLYPVTVCTSELHRSCTPRNSK